jgi:hypothetical protein
MKDPIKVMIAQAVQHHLLEGPDKPPLPERPDNVESVEAHKITQWETQIRVKTCDDGVKYINVKVTMPW